MPARARIAETAFWLGIVIWISALVTAGMSAALAFPTLREFEVIVPRFEAHDHSAHWSIAAGLLMERMFFITDLGQMMAAVLVVAGLIAGYVTLARRVRQPMEMLRALCVVGAVLLLAYRVLLLAPDMNGSLQRYWHAAEQGHTEIAQRHRAEFQRLHPIASRTYGVMFVLLLGAVAASAWSPPTPTVAPTRNRPDEPVLARNARR